MTSKLVVNTIEADTGISSVSFASSISMDSTSKFHFSAAGIDIDADTNINRPAAGVIGFNINSVEKVRINSTGNVGIGTDNPSGKLDIQTGTNGNVLIDAEGGSVHHAKIVNDSGDLTLGSRNTSADTKLTSKRDVIILTGSSEEERLRIDSSGRVMIGTTAASTLASTDDLTISTSGSTGITLFSAAGNAGNITFGDGTSGDDRQRGLLQYHHSDNSMRFFTDAVRRMTIDPYGRVLIGGTSAIIGSSAEFSEIVLTGKTRGAGITLQDVDANTRFQIRTDDDNSGDPQTLLNASTNHPIVIRTNNTERLRINSNGDMGLGLTASYSGLFGGSQRTFQIGGTAAPCLRITSSTSNQADLVIHAGNSGRRADIANITENGSISMWTKPTGGSNTERLKISPDGYVTKPNQPSFAVYRNQQSWTIADGGKMNFNTARHNIGTHYDLSNGRFIAPVTGSYQLNFYSIVQGNYTNAYIQLKVNGNRIYGGDTHWTLTNNSGNWHNVSYSQVVYLTASQYVEIFSYTGTGSGNVVWHGNNWGCFSGHLIG